MPSTRVDNLPMNRQVSGYARANIPGSGGLFGNKGLEGVFEKRDVDPESVLFKRRYGSRRSTNTVPNQLGVKADINKGAVLVDYDFNSQVSNNWTVFATLRLPLQTEDVYTPIISFEGIYIYIFYDFSAHKAYIKGYNHAGIQKLSHDITPDNGGTKTLLTEGTDHRIMVRRYDDGGSAGVAATAWEVPAAGVAASVHNETDVEPPAWSPTTTVQLKLFGERINLNALAGVVNYDQVSITNFIAYDVSNFRTSEYEAIASDLTPTVTGTNTESSTYKLLWHETFTDGGDVLSFTDTNPNPDVTIYSYLVPTAPTTVAADPDNIHFGGQGVIEVPFYLDFDEYYWTPVSATARLQWVFQIELTLPKILADSTVFEFQDILRLKVFYNSGATRYEFRGVFSGTGTVNSTTSLTAGGTYEVFVGRNLTQTTISVTPSGGSPSAQTGTPDNPTLFNYDKMLGFVIGDTVDIENSQPFGGRIERIALHNEITAKWHPIKDAVFYYDATSVYGDQIIDRGNRALNSFAGVRMDSAAPFYGEGGFIGGSYVAATGGYLMSVSNPSPGYIGELRKSLAKDAVVQRRGIQAFMTSNGVNYLIDDFAETFRPLGIPRPSTKVSCTPQGVGVIDGFVRYAYRWVTKDGTVGPAMTLDPVDARGGTNVFLGAESFGLPGETPFGISFGECSGTEESRGNPGANTVESFIIKDTDGGSNHNLLRTDNLENGSGLTLETAFRVPELNNNLKESIFSQGVYATQGVDTWMADDRSSTFPWIVAANQECCFQFAFKYHPDTDATNATAYQTLFGIGARDQNYSTGNWFSGENDHYKLNALVVSIQPAENLSGLNTSHSIVICRDDPVGSHHRDDDLVHFAWDYNFLDNNEYSIFVRRGGSNHGEAAGTALIVSIYNHTLHDPDSDVNGWAQWPNSTDVEKVKPNFWPDTYQGSARTEVMWGASRHEGNATSVKTRKRNTSPSTTFTFNRIPAIRGDTAGTAEADIGTILYHGRMWRKDFPLQLLAVKGLQRYAARGGALSADLELDVAFCPDSSVDTVTGGWDYPRDLRVKYYKGYGGPINGQVFLSSDLVNSPILTYGWDMITTSIEEVDTLSDVPLWVNYSSRNEGSISVGVGSKPVVEIGKRKWWPGSTVQTFDEFENAIDLKQWTWVTLHFFHVARLGQSNTFDVWLQRVFIDGNTGDWGETFESSHKALQTNSGAGTGQYGLFLVGGLPGLAAKFEVEIAEVRLWDGEYYSAAGGGEGDNAFGPYLSNRIPPNLWDKLWHYLRFVKIDVDNVLSQAAMDQFGQKENGSGISQKGSDAVTIFQGAEVKDEADELTGTNYFIPFPEPPLSAIRGIQIFRTQVIPVTDEFPNGNANPNAVPDAWRASRDAPLYFLTEIPRGTVFHTDTAPDTALGLELDATTGLVPRDPRGVFEWGGYLGVYVQDRPRVHFAESPSSWESFPTDMIFDLPVREYGPIEAAIELASRDARQSRVLCLGKSWGVFLDGTPTSPQCNTLGGGVGAASPRCLVVEKGIAYAYNGTLWAITGDGQVEDIGIPVLDLLPTAANTRLSVSSALSSLFVIDESTGLALRFHLARRQWYVEDRYALSVTDIDGVDTWVHVSGYPSEGLSSVYQDDVESNTPTSVAVSSYSNGSTFVVASATGLKVGQRLTLVGDRGTGEAADARHRQTITIQSISSTTITPEETLALTVSTTALDGTTHTLLYNAYPGVGYWGTMLDTGQFNLEGDLSHVDIGIDSGDGWWASSDASDFAKDPTDRTGFNSAESKPTNIVDGDGSGVSARWGLSNQQRLERIMLWSPGGTGVGLTEVELNYMTDAGG